MADKTQDYRQVVRVEYVKCAKDPVYFMRKYVKIQHPIRGTIPFLTYPFQDRAVADFGKHRKNIVLKSRQMGITTLVAAYALWLMIFHDDKEIMCLSITQETSKQIVTKVRFANDNLPSWLKVKEVTDNQLSLRLSNGSQIKAVSSAGTSGRSSALSLLIIDEAAFIDGVEEIWLSAQNTLSTGGKAIILSTPNGVGNFFHQKWNEAVEGQNDFNMINLPWHLHPERDQAWRDEQTKLLGPKGAAQECDCEFSTSGNTVIDIPLLEWYSKNKEMMCDPIEKRGIDRGYWVWKYPEAGRSYLLSCDVGRGDSTDFSAVQIVDVDTLEQVAEYKGHLPTKEFGRLIAAIGTEYNMGLVVVENNNMGWAVLQELIDIGYQNLFYSHMDLLYVDVEQQATNKLNAQDRKLVPGFTTTHKSRPLIISKLESYIREKSLIIHSERLLAELMVFVWKNTGTTIKAEAMSGYNDDLVMSMGIGAWIRDTALRLRSESDSLTKTILSKMGGTSAQAKNGQMPILSSNRANPYGINADPWKMNIGNNISEDLGWLIR